MSTNVLLIIDMQNDFCHPDGALYVPGAEVDVDRLAHFIENNENNIDQILFTQDSHHVLDISHPGFWKDQQGGHPGGYTPISCEAVEKGEWQALFEPEKALEYLMALEKEGEFPHVIWPEHCILGSWGAAIHNRVMEAAVLWARKGRYYEVYPKGINPMTEHFGALRANVPLVEDASTQLNRRLVNQLRKADTIYVAGEARSHCVGNTIKQLLELEDLKANLVLLDDCMSNVPGFETISDGIYNEAFQNGAVSVESTNLNFN